MQTLHSGLAAQSAGPLARSLAEAVATKEGFDKDVRSSLRLFRVGLDAGLQGLRQANAALRASMRSFSEGGNFCAEEVSITPSPMSS